MQVKTIGKSVKYNWCIISQVKEILMQMFLIFFIDLNLILSFIMQAGGWSC